MEKLNLQQIIDRAEKVNFGFVKTYAEQKTIEGKSYLGNDTETIKRFPVKIKLHHSYCNPEEIIEEIEKKMKNKTIMEYYQNGKYITEVVIGQYQVTHQQMANGSIIYAEMELIMLEMIEKPALSGYTDLPFQTFSFETNAVQNFLEKANEIQSSGIVKQVTDLNDNFSDTVQQIFNEFKTRITDDFVNKGLSDVYTRVSEYIDSLNQNSTLEYYEKELLQIALNKVSKIFISGSIRQPVEDVLIESYALTDSSSQQWIMPCNGKIISPYGWRESTKSNHTGIDIYVPVGTPIRAIADGKVIVAHGNITGYGNAVYIDHGMINGKRVISEYGHLSKFNIGENKFVRKGTIIAYSGGNPGAPGSGRSQGPHLHLTIREIFNGKKYPVNPNKYIKM